MIRREQTTKYVINELEIPIIWNGNKTQVATCLEVSREETLPVYDPGDDPVWFSDNFTGYDCKQDGTKDNRSSRNTMCRFAKQSDRYHAICVAICEIGKDEPFRQELIEYYREEWRRALRQEEDELKELLDITE